MSTDPRIKALSDALEITERRAARALAAVDAVDPVRDVIARVHEVVIHIVNHRTVAEQAASETAEALSRQHAADAEGSSIHWPPNTTDYWMGIKTRPQIISAVLDAHYLLDDYLRIRRSEQHLAFEDGGDAGN